MVRAMQPKSNGSEACADAGLCWLYDYGNRILPDFICSRPRSISVIIYTFTQGVRRTYEAEASQGHKNGNAIVLESFETVWLMQGAGVKCVHMKPPEHAAMACQSCTLSSIMWSLSHSFYLLLRGCQRHCLNLIYYVLIYVVDRCGILWLCTTYRQRMSCLRLVYGYNFCS